MIKVLITDDHPLVIDGIRLMLSGEEDIEWVGQARNGRELLERLPGLEVDVLLLDINMPEMDGLQTIRALNRQYPALKVIALSMLEEPGVIKMMFRNGARGYLLKKAEKKEVLRAIRTVYQGNKYYSGQVTDIIMAGLSGETLRRPASPFPALTRREKQILRLITGEFTTGEIAKQLKISFSTVETHRKNLLIKLGARNAAGLVRIAMEYGLLE